MKKRNLIISSLTLLIMGAIPAKAVKIDGLSAGNLKNALAEIAPTETSLIISGSMNAADFSFIQDTFNDLKELDLSNVKIVKYSGNRLPYTGLSMSPDAALPAYSLTGLTSLESVKLPSGLKSIGKGAFSGTGIKSIDIPNSVVSIDDYAFLRCQGLKTVNIPSSVKSIGERAFAYCGNLATVNIATNSSLPTIPEGMFEASGLKTLSLSALAECKEIGPWALAQCNGLTTLILPEKTQTIGVSALAGTKSIQTLSLPKTTDYIADNAMSNMSGLTTLEVVNVENVPYLGESVWRNVNQKDVMLITADDMTDHFREADQWQNFNIVSESTLTTDNITTESGNNSLIVRREGNSLEVRSNQPIGHVSIYNVKGHLVAGHTTPKNVATFNIAGWAKGVYLIVSEAGVAKITI